MRNGRASIVTGPGTVHPRRGSLKRADRLQHQDQRQAKQASKAAAASRGVLDQRVYCVRTAVIIHPFLP
eukprot:COSAG01_NODE_3256_length_6345_cov_15.186359_3_plen_69_part_00